MNDMFSRLASSARLRAMLGVGGAAITAQAVTFAAAPVASRLFDEAAFGMLGLFVALANILAVPATLGLHDAIIATQTDREADALFSACILLTLAMGGPLGLVTYFMIALDLFGYGALPAWTAPMMTIEILAMATTMALQMHAIRRKRFRHLAVSHLALGGARAGGQITFGFLGLGAFGLCGSEVLSRVATAVAMMAPVRRAEGLLPVREFVRIREAVWTYRNFIYFRAPSGFMNSLNMGLPPILIAASYSIEDVGFFSLMYMVLFVPVGLIQKTVGDVFLGHFAADHREQPPRARRFLLQVVAVLAVVATPAALLLLFLGPELFAIVFGERWRVSGELAARMAPLLAIMSVVAPVSTVLSAVNRPEFTLIFNAARVTALGTAYLVAGAMDASMPQMVGAFAVGLSCAYTFYAGLIGYAVWHPR